MRVWVRVSAGVFAVALFFLSIQMFRRAPDPVFEGRLASAWVGDLLSSDYQTRSEAQTALQVLGEPGVPQLSALLRKRNAPWEQHLVKLNRWFPFLSYEPADAILCRQRGAEMVGLLRGKAAAALPHLLSSLAMEACASEAERALMRCGPLALPTLEKGLHDDDPTIRRRCAKLIGELKDVPPSAETALVGLARDRNGAVRAEVARTLGEVALVNGSMKATAALIQLTHDSEAQVRAAAMQSLGRQVRTEEIVTVLRQGLIDREILVRLEAAKGVWHLTKDSAAVLPVLTRILATREGWQAAYALADLEEAAAPAIPGLIQALERERVPRPYRTPPSCALALGRIGTAAIPALRPLLGAEDSRTRMNAVLAIGFMGSRGKPAVPELLPLLDDRDAEVRHATALTLATIGAEPGQVLAGLSACLGAEDIYMRSAAAQVLRAIAPNENWVVQPE